MMQGFIDEDNGLRIAYDAEIAINALNGIRLSAGHLHKDYLKEKINKIQQCIDFMKTFCEVKQ